MDNDVIKALRCLANQELDWGCSMDVECCAECQHYQKPYEVSIGADGYSEWLQNLAGELEKVIPELEAYHKIGTVEECREAIAWRKRNMKFPFMPGDVLYMPICDSLSCPEYYITEIPVGDVSMNGCYTDARDEEKTWNDDFGEDVFLTREEAEIRLEVMRKEMEAERQLSEH